MNNKKVLSLLLATVLLFGLAPFNAFAAPVAISGWVSTNPELVAQQINPQPNDPAAPTSPALKDSTTAWFGGYQWVVIGWDGKGVASKKDIATLLYADANSNKPTSRFDSSGKQSNVYAGSTLQTAINTNFLSMLQDKEIGYIVQRNLTGGSVLYAHIEPGANDWKINASSYNSAAGALKEDIYITGCTLEKDMFDWFSYHNLRTSGRIGGAAYTGNYHPDRVAGADVVPQYLWPLSVAEASLLHPTIRYYDKGGHDCWWLRSPGDAAYHAALVDPECHILACGNLGTGESVGDPFLVRPALNLDLSSVIFTSASSGANTKSAATTCGCL